MTDHIETLTGLGDRVDLTEARLEVGEAADVIHLALSRPGKPVEMRPVFKNNLRWQLGL